MRFSFHYRFPVLLKIYTEDKIQSNVKYFQINNHLKQICRFFENDMSTALIRNAQFDLILTFDSYFHKDTTIGKKYKM